MSAVDDVTPITQLDPEIVVNLVYHAYNALPPNFKPTIRTNGVPEWTILAALIVSRPTDNEPEIQLISLGTGVKCLPTNRLPPCGDTLHDSHAEILARRGFMRWLLEEALSLVGGRNSQWLTRMNRQFRLREHVRVHMYISALPCGNASLLHTAAHQPLVMATLKSASDAAPAPPLGPDTTRGRNGYTNTSALRTKPGRPDSFPSISMSCSDKIASWNALGLQGGLLARWFRPMYLDSIVIGGAYDPPRGDDVVGWRGSEEEWRSAILEETKQALYGRLDLLGPHLSAPYRLSRPEIHLTPTPFQYDKPSVSALHPSSEPAPQPTSVLQCRQPLGGMTTENLFQGCDRRTLWKPPGLEPIPEKRRSTTCKLEMLRAAIRLDAALNDAGAADCGDAGSDGRGRTYHDWKHEATPTPVQTDHPDAPNHAAAYQAAKATLRGVPGVERLVPGFEKCGMLSSTEPLQLTVIQPPFPGWLVSGHKWESFDEDGRV